MIFVASAIVILSIVLWATGWLPDYLAALLFFALATVTGVAPPAVIFSGFASTAFWLILSGFVMGIAIRKTGLADRVARLMAIHLRGSYFRMVVGIVAIAYGLAFVMPSNMGRIALLMPIVMAFADRAGLAPGTPGRHGLALAVGFGTFLLSTTILPSNVPNQVMAGAIETSYGLHLAYMPYLALHTPVLGILKGAIMVACLCWMFPGHPHFATAPEAPTAFTPDERRLSVVLGITLALWFTDAWHGIAPAWVGLSAACFCLMPKIGFIGAEEFSRGTNFRTLFFIASVLGLSAMVTQTGIADAVGGFVTTYTPLDPAAPFASFVALTGLSTLFNFVVTANGTPALYTPLARHFADASGFSLMSVLMIQVIGFSTPFLPYQATPVIVTMELGDVPASAATRLAIVLAVITLVLLVPLDFLWFRLLGLV